jgi:hypothetical protein
MEDLGKLESDRLVNKSLFPTTYFIAAAWTSCRSVAHFAHRTSSESIHEGTTDYHTTITSQKNNL